MGFRWGCIDAMTDTRATREANKEAVHAELHNELLMQLPYEEAVPDLDKSGFCDMLAGVFTKYQRCDVVLTDVYELVDPNQLIARYSGDFRGRDKDVHHANNYVGIFRLP